MPLAIPPKPMYAPQVFLGSPQARGLYQWWPSNRVIRNGRNLVMREVVRGAQMDSNAANDTPEWRWGPYGAYPFHNTHQCRTGTDQPFLDLPVTIVALVTQDSGSVILSHHAGVSNNGYRVSISGTTVRFTLGGVADYNGPTGFVGSEWQWVAVSADKDNGTAVIYHYLNNTLDSVSVSIGAMSGTPDRWAVGAFNGLNALSGIADLRVYSRVLSEGDLLRIFHDPWDLYLKRSRRRFFLAEDAGAGGGGPPPRLVGGSNLTLGPLIRGPLIGA